MSFGVAILVRCLAFVGVLMPAASIAAGNSVEKYALVIGNRDYLARQASLPNAVNDANLLAKSLRAVGFKVTQRNNLKRDDFFAATREFAAQLPEGSTALVYYAGHGMQIGGGNFLTPVDMAVTSEQSVAVKSYPLKSLLEQLAGAKSAVNVVVLDACRNNPFQPQSAVRYRSFADLGLAKTQAPRGTLIAYSTSPGQLAADGTGSNSIYSAALARQLAEPERELEEIFKRVSSEVRKSTLDDQIPWYESSLTERYYFVPPQGVSVVAGKPLIVAKAPTPDARGVQRSSPADQKAMDLAWYRQLTAKEWSQIDWEIRQRVNNITPDEIPVLTHKASGGSVVAQTTLGLAYREGVEKAVESNSGRTTRYKANNNKALKWLKTAAENGFPVAQTELGGMYFDGHGVDRDLRQAAYWLEQAAVADYPRAKAGLLQVRVASGQPANIEDALSSMLRSMSVPGGGKLP